MIKLSCHRFFTIPLLTMQAKVVPQVKETDKSVHGQGVFAFNTFKSDITWSKGFSKNDQRPKTSHFCLLLTPCGSQCLTLQKVHSPGSRGQSSPEAQMTDNRIIFLFF